MVRSSDHLLTAQTFRITIPGIGIDSNSSNMDTPLRKGMHHIHKEAPPISRLDLRSISNDNNIPLPDDENETKETTPPSTPTNNQPSPTHLRTSTNTTRHGSSFISRKRSGSSKVEDSPDLEQSRKWKNRKSSRLLRSFRQESCFEEEDETNETKDKDGNPQPNKTLLRQISVDPDDDSSETGFGTFVCIRQSTVCKYTFSICSFLFDPAFLAILLLSAISIYTLNWFDIYDHQHDHDVSENITLITKLIHKIPGKATATTIQNNFAIYWSDFLQLLPEKLQDPVKWLAPGVVLSRVFSILYNNLYVPFLEELNFNDAGFGDRVSISINTLEESDAPNTNNTTTTNKRSYRQKLVMRTVKEMGLEELLPNQSALKLMKRAGNEIQQTEDGPVVALFQTLPCNGWFDRLCCSFRIQCRKYCCLKKEVPEYTRGGFCRKYCRKYCCLKKEVPEYTRGGFCGCLPRSNSIFCCGTVKHHYLYCDPILRFQSCDAGLKKKISDQIINALSESTTGSHFLGYEMGLSYKTVEYVWGLTYEQPIDDSNNVQHSQNRKYRILLARREMVDFAIKEDAWDVFTVPGKKYLEYCDRRWVHLRTIGQIFDAREKLANKEQVDGIKNNNDYKTSLKWLNTFFVGKVQVVAPMPTSCIKCGDGYTCTKRAWEKGHPWKKEHEKWVQETVLRKASEESNGETLKRSSNRINEIKKQTLRLPSSVSDYALKEDLNSSISKEDLNSSISTSNKLKEL